MTTWITVESGKDIPQTVKDKAVEFAEESQYFGLRNGVDWERVFDWLDSEPFIVDGKIVHYEIILAAEDSLKRYVRKVLRDD